MIAQDTLLAFVVAAFVMVVIPGPTVLFTIGRLPGWNAHWREQSLDPATKIGRPRQVYTGVVQRDYVPSDQR